MGLIASRFETFEGSAIVALYDQAVRLRREGRDILDLRSGEPDFPTPENVCEAAHRAIREGVTKYTAVDGTREMKEAVRLKFERDNGLRFELDEICVGAGAKPLIALALTALLDPGDEIIIPVPAWPSFPGMVSLAGGVSRLVPCDAASGYKLTPRDLASHIGPRAKCLILNQPSNPTGAVYSRDELAALGAVIAEHERLVVLADELYEHLVYETPFTAFAAANPELRDRTLTVNGLSKGYAMTGWRVGFAAGPAEVMDTMRRILSQSAGNPSSMCQVAAIEALTGPQAFLAERAEHYQRRRDRAAGLLNEAPGLRCEKPPGAFYLYPSCTGAFGRRSPGGTLVENSADLCEYFLESQGVAVVPASGFHSEGNFRLSYSYAEETLDEGCRRIVTACQALRG